MAEELDESRKQSQELHKESQRQYDKIQNSLCFVVIGTILVIIGIIFIFLAYKRENNELVGIDITSLAFYICVIALGVGGVLLIYGLVKLLISLAKRKKVLAAINKLSK